MTDFDETWKTAVKFRRTSRDLQGLLFDVYRDLLSGDLDSLRVTVERMLVFLASPDGRTDANCSTVDAFFNEAEQHWRALPEPWRALFDDMSGTLHDAIYRPDIARTFEATPEQLLQRVRNIVTNQRGR